MLKRLGIGIISATFLFLLPNMEAFAESSSEQDFNEDSEKKQTENHEVDLNEAWGKAENDELNSEIDFGSEEDSDSKNQINKKWGELSTGKTNIALSDDVKNMTSTGTSKGKVLTTVTSAKTSAKNTDTDTRIDGSKKQL